MVSFILCEVHLQKKRGMAGYVSAWGTQRPDDRVAARTPASGAILVSPGAALGTKRNLGPISWPRYQCQNSPRDLGLSGRVLGQRLCCSHILMGVGELPRPAPRSKVYSQVEPLRCTLTPPPVAKATATPSEEAQAIFKRGRSENIDASLWGSIWCSYQLAGSWGPS